jgi:hypothetical protein
MHGWLSSYLKFWTTLAPLVLFCNVLEILFQKLLQIVKGIWRRFSEAFSRFEIFSPVLKCFSFDQTKLPLNEILLLVFKRVLDINFERGYTILKILSKIRYQLNILLLTQIWKTTFLKLVMVRSFCFGLILSPPLAWIAKTDTCEWNISPFCQTFSPFGK